MIPRRSPTANQATTPQPTDRHRPRSRYRGQSPDDEVVVDVTYARDQAGQNAVVLTPRTAGYPPNSQPPQTIDGVRVRFQSPDPAWSSYTNSVRCRPRPRCLGRATQQHDVARLFAPQCPAAAAQHGNLVRAAAGLQSGSNPRRRVALLRARATACHRKARILQPPRHTPTPIRRPPTAAPPTSLPPGYSAVPINQPAAGTPPPATAAPEPSSRPRRLQAMRRQPLRRPSIHPASSARRCRPRKFRRRRPKWSPRATSPCRR